MFDGQPPGTCPRCDGVYWVCENHPQTPYRDPIEDQRGCKCGPAMLCPVCEHDDGEG